MRHYLLCKIAALILLSSAPPATNADGKKPGPESLTLKEKLSQKTSGYVRCIGFSPDGKSLAVAFDPDIVSIWDVASGTEKHRFLLGDAICALAWEPKGRRFFAAVMDAKYYAKNIVCWDLDTKQQVFSVNIDGPRPRLAVHPDGKEFTVVGLGRKGEIRNSKTGEVMRSLVGSLLHDLAIAPDGKKMAMTAPGNSLKISDMKSGEEFSVLKGHDKPVEAICYDSTGKRLASSGMDQTVKIWDTEKAKAIITTRMPYHAPKIALSPNGKWVAVGALNTRTFAKLYDAERGNEVAELKKVKGTHGLAFNRDGSLLAAAWGHGFGIWEITEPKTPAEKEEKKK
jgi:WD40 repeat protein